jgi:hypothetical protein
MVADPCTALAHGQRSTGARVERTVDFEARTATASQLQANLIMAPEPVRARFRGFDAEQLVAAVLRCCGFDADRWSPTLWPH